MKKMIAAGLAALLTFAGGSLAVADRAEKSGVAYFSRDDSTMNAAMENARRTVPAVVKRLTALQDAGVYVSVKVPVAAQGQVEHIWLDNLSFSDGAFHGTLDNQPVSLAGWAEGDPISVPAKRISDWIVILNDRLYGGYTIHIHRAAMSPQEQRQFDESFGATIPDRPISL
jgi:uncharacterized protein YegJ (DUF2314 family)